MIDLEKELEKYRKTTKENPDFFKNLNLNRKKERKAENEIWDLAEEFLYLAVDNEGIYDLVNGCLIDSKNTRCFRVRTDESVKLYNPEQVYKRLKKLHNNGSIYGLFIEEKIIIGLEELNLKKGFNKQMKNFVANVYKIIYDAYLKEYTEKRTTAH